MSIVTIIPKMRLYEAAIGSQFNLKKRTIGGTGATDPNDDGEPSIADIVSAQSASQSGVTYKEGHGENTQAVYALAEQALRAKLSDIEFKLVYKLANIDQKLQNRVSESETIQIIDPKEIYDVEILSVGQNAAYIIHDETQEIHEQQIDFNPMRKEGKPSIVRDDILSIVINSPQYQETFKGKKVIKVKKK